MVVIYCLLNVAIIFGLMALWVLRDSLGRSGNAILWSLGTLLMAPVILPVYLARRPLQSDEVRTGGPDWIVARHFAWVWTIFMLVIFGWTLALTLSGETTFETASEGAERAQAVSRGVALFLLCLCWLLPAAGALFLAPRLFDPLAKPELGPAAEAPESGEAVEVVSVE